MNETVIYAVIMNETCWLLIHHEWDLFFTHASCLVDYSFIMHETCSLLIHHELGLFFTHSSWIRLVLYSFIINDILFTHSSFLHLLDLQMQ